VKNAAVLAPAAAAVLIFTVWVTWPQSLYLATYGADHQDTFFSMWRLGWIAHVLPRNPLALFDANIFHPSRDTLAFSDAMLLEGLLAAPLFWIGVPPVLVYNLMLFAGFAGSGLAMFVLAHRLTGAFGPALVAAAAFTMAPFRIEHFMHLELQWTMWIPLTLWAVHRAVDETTNRLGALAGAFLTLQVLACVYYGVFLAISLVVFVPLLLLTAGRRAARAIVPLGVAMLVAVLLTLPYGLPYVRNARTLGPRDTGEIARFSAQPINYLTSPPQNLLWGWTAPSGGPELNLYAGMLTVALALVALTAPRRKSILPYVMLALFALEMSFGSHGRLYPWVSAHAGLLQGLRAPARFSIVAVCALAVLAAFGAQTAQRRFVGDGRWRSGGFLAVVLFLLCVDYGNSGMIISRIEDGPYRVYEMMRNAGPGVLLELPSPRADRLPGNEQFYAFWSRSHWQPLVNGYSGYYPRHYIQTLGVLQRFPDDRSVQHLRNLRVRYVIVHRGFYEPDRLTGLLVRLAARGDFEYHGTFAAPSGPADLFSLGPSP
jgi:hypothetical protein